MLGKKANIKIKSPIFILLIVVILLVSSTMVFMIGGHSKANNSLINVASINGSSELYLAVSPEIYPGYLMTKEIGNGQSITFDNPGTSFNFSENETINMTVSVINHQNKAMNYSIMAYQMVNNTVNNTYNISQLYNGHLDTMPDHSIGWCNIMVQPSAAYDTILGVILTDVEGDNVTILNDTEFTVNVFPRP